MHATLLGTDLLSSPQNFGDCQPDLQTINTLNRGKYELACNPRTCWRVEGVCLPSGFDRQTNILSSRMAETKHFTSNYRLQTIYQPSRVVDASKTEMVDIQSKRQAQCPQNLGNFI